LNENKNVDEVIAVDYKNYFELSKKISKI